MMKQLVYNLLALMAGLTACTSIETDVLAGGNEKAEAGVLSIRSLSLTVDTKAIYDGIGSGQDDGSKLDNLGVLVTKENVEGKAVYYSSKLTTQTFLYTAADDGEMHWAAEDTLKLEDADGTLYAWAPLHTGSPGVLTTGADPVPVVRSPAIRSVQTYVYGNEWQSNQTDYLYGSKASKSGDETHTTVNRTDYTVDSLYMQHALCKLSFRIMKCKDQKVSDEDFVKKIKLSSADRSPFVVTPFSTPANLTMSLVDGSLTDAGGDGSGLSDTLTLTATTRGKIAAYKAKEGVEPEVSDFASIPFAHAYGLVVNAGDLIIELTLGPDEALDADKDRTFRSGKNALKGITWVKGTHYLYTMTVSDRGLSIGNISVTSWDGTSEPVDIPVEPVEPEVPAEQ